MEFTYAAYEGLLSAVLDNYEVVTYSNYLESEKPCILRHDIDCDIPKALEMAKFEKNFSEKIRSTYFVLVSTDMYNPFSKANRKALESILGLGHVLGLHFDETVYDTADIRKMTDRIRQEAHLFETALGIKMETVSMHRPSRNMLDSDIEIPGMINSYGKTFFEEFKYVSDSRMRWREDVCAIIDGKKHSKLHILTHPFWYANEQEQMGEKLLGFIKEAPYQRYKVLNENFSDLQEVVPYTQIQKEC